MHINALCYDWALNYNLMKIIFKNMLDMCVSFKRKQNYFLDQLYILSEYLNGCIPSITINQKILN